MKMLNCSPSPPPQLFIATAIISEVVKEETTVNVSAPESPAPTERHSTPPSSEAPSVSINRSSNKKGHVGTAEPPRGVQEQIVLLVARHAPSVERKITCRTGAAPQTPCNPQQTTTTATRLPTSQFPSAPDQVPSAKCADLCLGDSEFVSSCVCDVILLVAIDLPEFRLSFIITTSP